MPDNDCQCGLNMDYSQVNEGQIECKDCGRRWILKKWDSPNYAAWWPFPCPGCGKDPRNCYHYGGRNKSRKR